MKKPRFMTEIKNRFTVQSQKVTSKKGKLSYSDLTNCEEIVIDQPEITCANLNAKIHFETYEDYERVD